jgi:hypothetical protein
VGQPGSRGAGGLASEHESRLTARSYRFPGPPVNPPVPRLPGSPVPPFPKIHWFPFVPFVFFVLSPLLMKLTLKTHLVLPALSHSLSAQFMSFPK